MIIIQEFKQQNSIDVNECCKDISFEVTTNPNVKGLRQFVKIERDLSQDSFTVLVTFFTKKQSTLDAFVQINNSVVLGPQKVEIGPESFGQVYFPITQKSIKFSKLENMNIYANYVSENQNFAISNSIKFNENRNNKTDFFVQGDGIAFESLQSIQLANLGNEISRETSESFTKINNFIVYLFPEKFQQEIYNTTVFKVGVNPVDFKFGNLRRQINISAGKLTNIPIEGKSGLDLQFQFRPDLDTKDFEPEIIQGKYIIGDILITNNTYYDSDKQQVVLGNNSFSQKGYLIPFNFSGKLTPKASLTINSDYKDISVAFVQDFKRSILHKTQGIYKLKVKTYKKPFITGPAITISDADFEYISKNPITIDILKNIALSKNEQEELDENLS